MKNKWKIGCFVLSFIQVANYLTTMSVNYYWDKTLSHSSDFFIDISSGVHVTTWVLLLILTLFGLLKKIDSKVVHILNIALLLVSAVLFFQGTTFYYQRH